MTGLASALAVVGGARPVSAQEVLLVQSGEGAAPWVGEVQSAVLGELRARGRDVVLMPRPPARAQPSLASAREAFHDLRPLDALRLLDVWAEAVAETPGLGADQRVEGHVWRARVLMALSRPGVDAALDSALAVDPTLRLDEAQHPPALRARLDARRASLRLVSVELRVRPRSALVRIDGRPATPGLVRLVTGSHLVSVEAGRHEPAVLNWRVEGPDSTLEVALSPLAGHPGEPVPPRTLEALRGQGRRALVLQAERGPDGIHLALHDVPRLRRAGPGHDAGVLAAQLFAPAPLVSVPQPAEPQPAEPQPAEPQPAEPHWLAPPREARRGPSESVRGADDAGLVWGIGIGAGALLVGALVVGLVVGLEQAPGFDAVGMREP